MSQVAPASVVSRHSVKNSQGGGDAGQSKRRKHQPSNRQQQASVQLASGLAVTGRRNTANSLGGGSQQRSIDKRNSASTIQLYQIEPVSLFERGGQSALATPQQRPAPDYNIPKIFMSLSKGIVHPAQQYGADTFNYNSQGGGATRPFESEQFMMASQQEQQTAAAEEVLPDGVNRPNSLEVVNRHGSNTQQSQKSKASSLYEQLRLSSGLNPFKSGIMQLRPPASSISEEVSSQQIQTTPYRNRPNIIEDDQQHLDRKITEILGKYLSPQKLQRQTEQPPSQEFQALKQISDTLNTKLDTFQQQLQSINVKPSLPVLYTTETQTEDDNIRADQVETYDELRIELMRVQERLAQERQAQIRDQALMNEHLAHYQGQVSTQQSDIARLQELLRTKKETEDAQMESANAQKESLIKQLTAKLQEQNRKAKDLKVKVGQMEEAAQQREQEEAVRLEEQSAVMVLKEKDALDSQKRQYEQIIDQWRLEQQRLSQQISDLQGRHDHEKSEWQRAMEEIRQAAGKQAAELQDRQRTLERKDSEHIKTRDRLSNIEKDMMALREQNRQLKADLEDKTLTIDGMKRSDSAAKGSIEQQAIKLKEQLSQEKLHKGEAEEQVRSLTAELAQIKEFGRNKLQALESEKRELLQTVETTKSQLQQSVAQVERLEGEGRAERQNNALMVDGRDQLIRELEAKVESMRAEILQLQPKLDKKRQSISMIKQLQEQTQSEMRIKEGQLELLNKQYEQEIRMKTQQIFDQNEKIGELQGELKQAKTTVGQLELQIQAQRDALLKGNEAQIQQVQQQLAADKQHLMTELSTLQEAKDAIQEKFKAQKSKTADMKRDHETEVTELKARQSAELEKLQEKLSQGVVELLNKTRDQQAVASQIQTLNDQFTRELSNKQYQYDDINEKYQRVLNDIREKQRSCDDMQQTITILYSQSTDQETKRSQLLLQLQSTVESLQNQLEAKERDMQAAATQYSKQIQAIQVESQEALRQARQQLVETQDALSLKEIEAKRSNDQVNLQSSLSSKLTEQLRDAQESLINDKQVLNKQINKLVEDKTCVEKELVSKKDECETLRQQKQALMDKVENKRIKSKAIKGQLKSAEDESSQVKRQMSEVASELQTKMGESIREAMLKRQEVEKSKKDQEQLKAAFETQIADLQRVMQLIQQQKKEREDALEEEVKRVHQKLADDKQGYQQQLTELDTKLDSSKREIRELLSSLEAAKGEVERSKLSQNEKGIEATQQYEQIERLHRQVQDLQREARDREDQQQAAQQQAQSRQQEAVQALSLQIVDLQQQHHKATMEMSMKLQIQEQKAQQALQRSEQLTEMSTQVNTALIERDGEVAKLKKDLQARDKEIQDFFGTDYRNLQSQYDQSQEKVRSLEQKVGRLLKELEDTGSKGDQEKPLMDELKKKNQLIMVKEAEIDSLKVLIKELKETVDQNDSNKELQELKKQHSFTTKEKAMKDMMIEQLKKELERNVEQIVLAKEKEAQMANVINALTVQNAMINATKQPPQGGQGGKKGGGGNGRPNLSLI